VNHVANIEKGRFSGYLIFTDAGISRFSKRTPRLKGGEHAIRISMHVPTSVFRNAIPSYVIDVPESKVISGVALQVEQP
jgi:hypothetical protein